MNVSKPGRWGTDIVRELIADGTSRYGPARVGPLSRLLRRIVRRIVGFEHLYHNQIDLALVEALESLRSEFDVLEKHIMELEERVTRVARRVDDVDTRAAVATSLADDVAETVDALSRDLAAAVEDI